MYKHLLLVQAFLNFRGLDFRDFQYNAVYNSILFSSPLAGIYRWSIILADTDFFQQSVSAANFRGRNNRPSAKHFFIKLLAKVCT